MSLDTKFTDEELEKRLEEMFTGEDRLARLKINKGIKLNPSIQEALEYGVSKGLLSQEYSEGGNVSAYLLSQKGREYFEVIDRDAVLQ